MEDKRATQSFLSLDSLPVLNFFNALKIAQPTNLLTSLFSSVGVMEVVVCLQNNSGLRCFLESVNAEQGDCAIAIRLLLLFMRGYNLLLAVIGSIMVSIAHAPTESAGRL